MGWHLLDWTGINNGGARPYLFWSGIGSNWQLLGALAVFWRAHNCHEPRCWRLGKHPYPPYKYCAIHHPDIP